MLHKIDLAQGSPVGQCLQVEDPVSLGVAWLGLAPFSPQMQKRVLFRFLGYRYLTSLVCRGCIRKQALCSLSTSSPVAGRRYRSLTGERGSCAGSPEALKTMIRNSYLYIYMCVYIYIYISSPVCIYGPTCISDCSPPPPPPKKKKKIYIYRFPEPKH